MRKSVKNSSVPRRAIVGQEERCPVATKAVHQVKRTLRQQFFAHFADARLLDLSLNEAEAIAWETNFPHLFFPALAEEKVAQSLAWAERQRALKASTSELCFAA